MLDSSPAALPPARKSLKRSASTASLASMPTPPRTHRKHARGRSRGSCDSDSDDNALISSDEEAPDAHRSKKRRTSEAVANDEDAFWLGGATADADAAAAGSSRNSKTQAAPLLYRKKLTAQPSEVAPVSPPPSHRRPAVVMSSKSDDATLSPPRTPRTRSATKRALRDSPGNPFLATPENIVEDSATPSPSASSANQSPHTPNNQEKPTLVYVFRGVRRVYQNPLYNHAKDRPYSPPPASKLPIDDPEYSPAIHCTPKLLFPAARRNTKGKKAAPRTKATKRARSPSLSGDELDPADIRPQKLNFLDPEKNAKTLDQELKSAGEPLSL